MNGKKKQCEVNNVIQWYDMNQCSGSTEATDANRQDYTQKCACPA